MNIDTDFLSTPLSSFDFTGLTLGEIFVGGMIIFFVSLLACRFILLRFLYVPSQANNHADNGLQPTQSQLDELLKKQSEMQAEMQGRMSTMAELFGSRQSQFNQDVNQRLDGMSQKLGNSLIEQTRATQQNLSRLQERLSVIDAAQNNIQTLAQNVIGLQNILSNKQSRGAFGQSRMESIVKDGLPIGAFEFQPTLSNNKRPDCTIIMPNGAPKLVIDAKFPLESWHAINKGSDEASIKEAKRQFRINMEKHIKDIADKYLIAGETQDTAFMFVPSESVFAEIHENFEDIVQRGHRVRVVIVSPSLLMLSIQVIQAILKDVHMREQAGLIQKEVIELIEDMGRLDDRVRKLHGHFTQSQHDIDQILISTGKIIKRGAKIETVDLQDIKENPKIQG